jgi:transcription initiation factor TFIIA large subunit
MAANTAAQQHHLGNGQTDGAGDAEDGGLEDFEGVLMRQNEAGELQELGRVEIDNLLHRHIAARAKAMEGGGLMVPLREATQHRTTGAFNSAEPSGPSRLRKIAGNDGGDDEEDEDAINSDLDDPEDDEGDPDADDEGLGHIMLCMYDKVQRVKNKW